MEIAVGCDVSKSRIDVVITGSDEKRLQVANQAGGIEAFTRSLPAGSCVGMESTGTFHEQLADTLAAAGHRVFVINPRWIRAYARSLGMRGKSDRSDAMVIARYVAAEHQHLHAYVPPTEQQRELRGLLQRRLSLAKLAAATKQSLGHEAAPILEGFKRVLKQLERRISELIKANPDWKSLAKRLRQLPGVGPLTAAQLVASLTRIPFANVDAFIAHTGTDPRPNDSGQKRGRRRLTHHGSAQLRSLLYMAAMAASRSPQWRAYFQAQRAKGLPTTAAYVIVARRIARIAFSLFRSGQDYDPERQPSAGAA
jgi:transposase